MSQDAKRQQIVDDLRKWRLNQPYMTSEQAIEQMERIRRNVQARSMENGAGNGMSSCDGHEERAASSMAGKS